MEENKYAVGDRFNHRTVAIKFDGLTEKILREAIEEKTAYWRGKIKEPEENSGAASAKWLVCTKNAERLEHIIGQLDIDL